MSGLLGGVLGAAAAGTAVLALGPFLVIPAGISGLVGLASMGAGAAMGVVLQRKNHGFVCQYLGGVASGACFLFVVHYTSDAFKEAYQYFHSEGFEVEKQVGGIKFAIGNLDKFVMQLHDLKKVASDSVFFGMVTEMLRCAKEIRRLHLL